MDLEYVEAAALAETLRSGSTADVVVVDVRSDGEFTEGHITGAVNVPSERFTDADSLDKVATELSADSSKTIIFHCMKSQVRGPTCARQFAEKFASVPESERPTM